MTRPKNPGIAPGAAYQSGSIVGEEAGGGNLKLSLSHSPSNMIMIERADLDDLMVVLDKLLGYRQS